MSMYYEARVERAVQRRRRRLARAKPPGSRCAITVWWTESPYRSDFVLPAGDERVFSFTPKGYAAAVLYGESKVRQGKHEVMIDVTCDDAQGQPRGQIYLARCERRLGKFEEVRCVAETRRNRRDLKQPLAGAR